VMLPMISDVTEVDEALRLLRKACAEVRDEGYDIEVPQIGVMIEVPAAVYQARSLAKRVDFLSVGSNDLTQYILAVDRNNPRVANLYDSLHPAVLRALIQVVENGHQEGKHVSICGEMAGDPASALLLLAIGFDSFSMNASSVGRIKWVIRHFTYKKVAKLLQEVLGMESAVMIRCHLELALERAGLGHLIRVGR
jgi:phosphotransferase system, enzyme I, PtsP